MDYFAGLDVSMAETHICVVGSTGAVTHRARVPSTPADIAAELIDNAQGKGRARPSSRHHHACHAAARRRV